MKTSPLIKCKVAARLADKEEKGDVVRTSRREEKEQYRHASDHEQASLSLRSDGQAMGAVGPAFTLSHLWRGGRPSMSGARSSMPSSPCCAAAVRGDCCPTICRPGAPPTGTSDA